MGPSPSLGSSQSQLTASLDFLTDAAHLLRGAAPEASAHLMRHRAAVAAQANVADHELRQQLVCSACGHIMVAGQGTTVRLETCKGTRAAAPATTRPKAPTRTKVLTCGRCQRSTKISLAAPEQAVASRRGGGKLPPPPAPADAAKQPAAPSKAANASSKRRAKNRKAGLQALLSQQQRPAGSLTLADFVGN